MRTIDFSPLYRSVVGFDRLAQLLETASVDAASGYPPYNIERTDENAYRIEIAVAGFRPEEALNIEVKENLLTVTGRKAANDEPRRFPAPAASFAERNFERKFQLADYVVVTDAALADGLALHRAGERRTARGPGSLPHRDRGRPAGQPDRRRKGGLTAILHSRRTRTKAARAIAPPSFRDR